MRYAIGVDIGGSKILTGLVDENGHILEKVWLKSDVSSKEAMFQQVCKSITLLLEKIEHPLEELSLGAGIPGLVDVKNGTAIFQNNLPWENFPFVQKIKEVFPMFQQVTIDNDVCQATLAEWKKSQLKEGVLTFLTASTGIACQTIQNGTFIRGRGFSGEVGLLKIREKNGHIHTLEEEIGGNHFAYHVSKKLNKVYTTKEVFDAFFAQKKEGQFVKEWIEHFSIALYSIFCVIDPHEVILGGSILKLNPDLLPFIKKQLKQMMLPIQYDRLDHITISTYDNTAGLVGAALSALV